MAKKKQNQEVHSPIEGVEESISRAEQFIENNLRSVGIAIGAVIAVILLYFGYQSYIVEPAELEAQQAIFPAQEYFEADSLNKALNGYAGNMGFVQVADEFSGTKAGNLANYYAGVCYLNTGDYKNAIAYLEDFSSNDGTMNVIATGAIGDAFHELNQPEEALEYYEKAAGLSGNEFTTPIYLQKAAKTAEMLKDWKTALKYYNRMREEFPNADQSRDVEKFISYCEAKVAQS
ncbi:tetratricopeptide repeat protein [Phaeocystidibacter luteus]|uniref:Tetratricopeptide repeat protein n=1 Tax=Phaeocystidibacter luteus TaxID=911197 RepID=A0A6N6RM62_9FLAO|nr:tetratricopeptide repeat protein [Phaeocystidibacter luteus]KAB2814638.1 tetratricopeptide repeat protein [Phaeocystidibacter luteus]